MLLIPGSASAAPGDLDTSFGVNGKIETHPSGENARARGVAVQKDGKIVTVGETTNGDMLVARFNQDGKTADSSFSGDGFDILTLPGPGDSFASSVAIDPDGMIVVVGQSGGDMVVVRYTSDGTLDTSFGAECVFEENSTPGVAITHVSDLSDVANSVIFQTDKKIVVAGTGGDRMAVVRYTATGCLDHSFADSGIRRYVDPFAPNNSSGGGGLALQGNKIVVAGYYDVFDIFGFHLFMPMVVRLHSNGIMDADFGQQGRVIAQNVAGVQFSAGIVVRKDGSIVTAVGIAGGALRLMDFSANGQVDSDSTQTGVETGLNIKPIDAQRGATAVAAQGDRIVVAGSPESPESPPIVGVARFESDMTKDQTFSGDGFATSGQIESGGMATALAIHAGKIVTAGHTGAPTSMLLTRFHGAATDIHILERHEEREAGSYLAEVTSGYSGVYGAPTGSLKLLRGDDVLQVQPLDSNGRARLATGRLTPGLHHLRIVYEGDDLYEADTLQEDFTAQGETRTEWTIAQEPATAGQVRFTVKVISLGNETIPTGDVEIVAEQNGSQITKSGHLGSGGTAVVDLPLGPGKAQVRAFFEGSAFYLKSESGSGSVDVEAPTETKLRVEPDRVHVRQTVYFIATVSSNFGSPKGSVKLVEQVTGAVIGTGNIEQGQVIVKVDNLASGSHKIRAEFPGDAFYRESNSSYLSVTVEKIPSTVKLTAKSNPVSPSQAAAFDVAVTGDGSAPSGGNVKLVDEHDDQIGTGTLGANGKTTINVSDLQRGRSYQVTAEYEGNTLFTNGTSDPVKVDIQAATTLALSAKPDSADSGEPIVLTADVQGGATPTGVVTFTITMGGTQSKEEVGVANGKATLTLGVDEPLQPGTYSVTATYSGDGLHTRSDADAVEVQVQEPIAPLSITPPQVPSGVMGIAYPADVKFTAEGGTSPYSWAITSGDSAGLTIAKDGEQGGVLGGTPTSAGKASFIVTVTDSADRTAHVPVTVNVARPLELATASVDAVAGEPFEAILEASGGTAPYNWALAEDPPPPEWLTLEDGTLKGSPPADLASGTYTVKVRITDDDPQQELTADLNVDVHLPETVFVSTNSLPPATVGTEYEQTLTATGGSGTYTWTISGELPKGLELKPDGTLSGTPEEAGEGFTFTVTATDTSEPPISGDAGLELTVGDPLPKPTITTTGLPQATADSPYEQTLTAEGGTTPYTWTVTEGQLPAGLELDATTGAITGTPTTGGTTTFTVTATDANGEEDAQQYALVTAAADPSPTATPSPSPSTSDTPQVSTVPKGAPDTGAAGTGAPTPAPTPVSPLLLSSSLPIPRWARTRR